MLLRRAMHPARLATICASLAAIGCAGDDTNPALPPAADASTLDAALDATTDTSPPTPSLRRSPSPSSASRTGRPIRPQLNFCFAPHGTSAFQGPFLAQQSTTLDAGPSAALPYPNVSAYFVVAPGHYDGRVVVAGAANCDVAVAPDLTSLAPLAIGTFATLALLGSSHGAADGAPALQLAAFLDDGVGGAKLGLRFINAGFIGAVDLERGRKKGPSSRSSRPSRSALPARASTRGGRMARRRSIPVDTRRSPRSRQRPSARMRLVRRRTRLSRLT